ncbi:HAD family acid phosphatase [Bradyrhizobium sp. PMVTL-01]|uniref:phosphatase domain-containing protein n=1 Tax=Bradyrhizobium sp. PMVTL-01 TaxID=3434999 RepID=UPI003F726FF0
MSPGITLCYVFDIDGTIADCSHRLHHIQKQPADWTAFYEACGKDSPIAHILDLAHALSHEADIIFVTGRSEECRKATLAWLKRHLPSCGGDWSWSDDGRRDLYMRAAGDHRPDHIVKSELLDRLIADGHRPIMAFEDRDQVVKMWRERGIPCAQVAPGNF